MSGSVRWTQAELDAHNRRQTDPGMRTVEAAPSAPLPKPEYKSKTEALRAQALELDRRAGMIRSWAYESETMKLPGGARYTPDFKIEHNDGSISFEEVKGRKGTGFYALPVGKLKVKVAAATRPYWKFEVVFPGSRLGTWEKWEVPNR